jgi:hypothetical protein
VVSVPHPSSGGHHITCWSATMIANRSIPAIYIFIYTSILELNYYIDIIFEK